MTSAPATSSTPASSAFLCTLAWLGHGDRVATDVLVEVAGDRIVGVVPGVRRADAPVGAVRLPGLTLPGFANVHSHAFHRVLRGRTHDGRGSFWTWRDRMYEVAATLDPRSLHDVARATFAEMVMAGISCVGEFHYVHHQPDGTPYDDPNAMGRAIARAAADAGIRLTLLDTCYLHGGFDRPLEERQLRFGDGDADAWAARVAALEDADDVRIGAAVHSVRAVDPASIETVAAWADRRRAPLHAHVSEQPDENEQCRAAHGCTPTELLADHGALGARFTAVHATHVTAGDIKLLGEAGCGVCCCPTTERDLADGIGPTSALRRAGARLTFGTDSHAVIDILEEARAVELDERLATNVRGHHRPDELLVAACRNGHASLGWPEAGEIAPGALADLTTISLDSVRTTGIDADSALGTAVFAASAADVDHVVVGGRVVVRDGRHVSIDAVAELGAIVP